jgi:hypothetical protein
MMAAKRTALRVATMTKTPYSPNEIERVKDALLGEQRSAKCPKHNRPLKVVETLAWRDEGTTVKERMFNGWPDEAGWSISRISVWCEACGFVTPIPIPQGNSRDQADGTL